MCVFVLSDSPLARMPPPPPSAQSSLTQTPRPLPPTPPPTHPRCPQEAKMKAKKAAVWQDRLKHQAQEQKAKQQK